jgi:pimeloyl-ACP methyl ester carboxylesterase
LLPGLDGTGTLFDTFIKESPSCFFPIVVRYPHDACLSYKELEGIAQSSIPADEKYLILGESFSGPLALRIASHNPPNLLGVILVASFIKSPVTSWIKILPLDIILKIRVPLFMFQNLLIGDIKKIELLKALKEAISKVASNVIAARIYSILNVNEADSLQHIKVPILYLRALKDKLVGKKSLDEIISIKPDIVVAEIKAPHLLLQTQPRQAWQTILDFSEKRLVGLAKA